MKLLKNVGILTLSALLAFPTEAKNFSDTPDHWAKEYIEDVVDAGMMSGVGDGLFSPDTTMTMGQFAVVLVQGFYDGKVWNLPSDDHWADCYLNMLLAHDILTNSQGDSIVEIATGWEDQPVYRYQIAAMVSRLMEDKFPNADLSLIQVYDDITSAFQGYEQDLANVVGYGVMTGLSDHEFGVSGVFTRGAATVVISNLLRLEVLTASSTESVPDITVPEVTVPEVAVPEVTVPEVTVPEVTVPEVAEPEVSTPVTPVVVLPADTNGDGVLSQTEINAVFDTFKKEYPQGTRWTNSNSYYSSAMRITGYGCAGWAFMLSDAIFGTQARYAISRDELQAGDIWHTGSHWGMIMEVNGTSYVCTEGNFNSSIYWDYTRGTSYLTENVSYYSRYPKN